MIPSIESDWDDIQKFALTIDGYSLPDVAEMANSRSAKSLTELRSVLFFEQRRYRHFGHRPSGDELIYIKSLIQSIRSKIEIGELE
jgi:hypothetical protein